MHEDVAEALRKLAAEDQTGAFWAEQVLSEILADSPHDELRMAVLESQLISALQVSTQRLRTVRDALARFFELAGLERAEARCRDRAWEEAADRVEREPGQLDAVLRELMARPLMPPHLLDFQWSQVRGPVEQAAQLAVADELEAAFYAGRLDPAQAGWRDVQRSIARTVLDRAMPGRDETWLRAVEHERLSDWLQSRGSGRQALVDLVVGELLEPSSPHPDALAAVEPFRWLLELVGEGVELEGNRLPEAIADELYTRAGWPRPSRLDRWTKVVVAPADLVVNLSLEVGLLELRDGRLVPSTLGRSIVLDTEALWRHVCRWTLTDVDLGSWLMETMLLLLLARQAWQEIDLVAEAKTVARPEGYLVGPAELTGEEVPLDDSNATTWLHQLAGYLVALGSAMQLIEEPSRKRFQGWRVALSAPGRSTVLALLRGRATGPRALFVPLP